MRHKCLVELDEFLKSQNTRLVVNLLDDSDVFLATERIQNFRDGQKAANVICNHCPICGKKLKRGKAKP
jgi:hypothetical protein